MQPRALSDQPRRATLEPIPSQPTPSATPLVTQGIGAREQDSAREETSMNALEERRQRQDERGPEDIARRQHESTYGATELQASNKEHDAAVLERAQRQRPEVPAGDGAADAGGGGAEKGGSRKSGLEAVGGSRKTASDTIIMLRMSFVAMAPVKMPSNWKQMTPSTGAIAAQGR